MVKTLCLMLAMLLPQEDLALPPADTWDAEHDVCFVTVSGMFNVGGNMRSGEYRFNILIYDPEIQNWIPILCVARESEHIKLCKFLNRRAERRGFGERVVVWGSRMIIIDTKAYRLYNVILVEEMARIP